MSELLRILAAGLLTVFASARRDRRALPSAPRRRPPAPALPIHAGTADAVFDALEEGILLQDAVGRIYRCNPSAARILGRPVADLIGRSWCEWAGEAQREDGTPFPCDRQPPPLAARTGAPQVVAALGVPRPDGTLCWVSVRAQPLGRAGPVLITLVDLTERRGEQAIARRLREAHLLNRIIAATATHEPLVVLRTMCEELARALDLPQAAFALLDTTGKHLTVVAEYCAAGRPPAVGVDIPLANNTATQIVLETRRPLVVPNARNDVAAAPIREIVEDRGIASLLLVPVISRDKVIGTLGLDALTHHDFDLDEIALAENVARAVGQALEAAELYTVLHMELGARQRAETALRRRNAELAALHKTTVELVDRRDPTALLEAIVVRAGTLAGTPHGFIYVVEPESGDLVVRAASGGFAHLVGYRLPRGAGFCGRVCATGAPQVIPDYRAWEQRQQDLDDLAIHAIAGIPLRSGREIVGVLGLAYLDPQGRFAKHQIKLLERFAHLAALALENARLYAAAQEELAERKLTELALQHANQQLTGRVQDLEQRRGELTLLNELGDLLQGCDTEEDAFRIIGRYSPQLFPGTSGALYYHRVPELNCIPAVLRWGDVPACGPVLDTASCRALSSGRPYLAPDPGAQPRCPHMASCPDVGYLCVPLLTQGRALGLLHVRAFPDGAADPADAPPLGEPQQQLAVALAERVALALANLQLHESLRNQAIRDPLTGLFNRRHMEEALEREIQAAICEDRPIGIIMLDIDHFKQFNDTFGHGAGDTLLECVEKVRKEPVISLVASPSVSLAASPCALAPVDGPSS